MNLDDTTSARIDAILGNYNSEYAYRDAPIAKQAIAELLTQARKSAKHEAECREAIYQLTWCKNSKPSNVEYDSLIMYYTEQLEEIESALQQDSKQPKGDKL